MGSSTHVGHQAEVPGSACALAWLSPSCCCHLGGKPVGCNSLRLCKITEREKGDGGLLVRAWRLVERGTRGRRRIMKTEKEGLAGTQTLVRNDLRRKSRDRQGRRADHSVMGPTGAIEGSRVSAGWWWLSRTVEVLLSLLFLITTFSSCNSQTIQFTYLKCIIQWFFEYSRSHATITTIPFTCLSSSEKACYLLTVTPQILHALQPQATGNLLSV